MKKLNLLLWIIFWVSVGFSQENQLQFTLNEAVKYALENNYDFVFLLNQDVDSLW